MRVNTQVNREKLLGDKPLHVVILRAVIIAAVTCGIVALACVTVVLITCADCTLSGLTWEVIFPFFGLTAGLFSIILFVVGLSLCFVGLARVFGNWFPMIGNTTDQMRLAPWWVRWNRNNVLFYPVYLNEKGMQARKRLLTGFLLFLSGLLLSAPAIIFMESDGFQSL